MLTAARREQDKQEDWYSSFRIPRAISKTGLTLSYFLDENEMLCLLASSFFLAVLAKRQFDCISR